MGPAEWKLAAVVKISIQPLLLDGRGRWVTLVLKHDGIRHEM
jgi:hypothetical protein